VRCVATAAAAAILPAFSREDRPMSDTSPTIAIVRSYDDLRRAIAERRKELDLVQLELDDLTGLPSGYIGKLECGMRSFGSLSLGLVLQALGIELIVRRRAA
jgi:hypothetical protein